MLVRASCTSAGVYSELIVNSKSRDMSNNATGAVVYSGPVTSGGVSTRSVNIDERTAKIRRRARASVFVVAVGLSVLAFLLVVAAWQNDRTITSDEGRATAEVLSAGKLRSAISFVTPDGVTHNPELGVLYPTNLIAGQNIDVEYARSEPDATPPWPSSQRPPSWS